MFFCALNLSPGGTLSTVYPRVVRLRSSGTQTAPKSCPPLPGVSFHIIPLALPHLTFLLPTGRLAGSFPRQPCGLIDSLPLLTAGEVLDVPTGERINHRGLTRCFEVAGTGGRAFPRSAASPIAWEGQKSTECVQPKGCLWQLLSAARLGARGCSEMEAACLPCPPAAKGGMSMWRKKGGSNLPLKDGNPEAALNSQRCHREVRGLFTLSPGHPCPYGRQQLPPTSVGAHTATISPKRALGFDISSLLQFSVVQTWEPSGEALRATLFLLYFWRM